jgi:hypothetical protein
VTVRDFVDEEGVARLEAVYAAPAGP